MAVCVAVANTNSGTKFYRAESIAAASRVAVFGTRARKGRKRRKEGKEELKEIDVRSSLKLVVATLIPSLIPFG